MKIALTTLCYNEEKMIPHFLRHYRPWVDQITVYDNQSTDSSRDLLHAAGVTVYDNVTDGEISDLRYLDIKNNSWKSQRDYDWQIVVDMDEFLVPIEDTARRQLEYYKECGITIVNSVGYNMLNDAFPAADFSLFEACPFGSLAQGYGKVAIFDPQRIEEINYAPGAHLCRPVGELVLGWAAFKLLHYRYFGWEHWRERNEMYAARVKGAHQDGYADAYLAWQRSITTESQFLVKFGYANRTRVC